ncbi:hypothetical protein B0H14DRAFT_3483572 [Mycena olivaceomarginata]|nr:hypothetical protein B0H14DRAFT_3483572 [Mycena olivaceomarginata]
MSDDGQAEKKRVKWHRGLSTAVFLDEVEPRPNARPRENVVKKGRLASTAKSPLEDLIEENVVVKKLVYDNDEPVVPVAVVKNTRSKAKKKS